MFYVPTKDEYMFEVERGNVTRRVHPEDSDVVILNYTQQAVYDRVWNPVTLGCRGLILNERTGQVLALPFRKFFNHGQIENSEVYSIPKNKPHEITVKMDGSLGISYRLDDGTIRWATRGSFESEQAKVAQRIWDKKYKEIEHIVPKKVTLLVEIISPETRVVIPYDYEDLVLIGMIKHDIQYEFTYGFMSLFAKKIGMRVTERVQGDLYSILERVKTLDHHHEGFVLQWNNGDFRLKVKSEEYLNVHRILYGLSDKTKLAVWYLQTQTSFLLDIPEEFRIEIEELFSELDMRYTVVELIVNEAYVLAPDSSRKDFAKYVIDNYKEYSSLLFKMYDGRLTNEIIREFVVKQYKKEHKINDADDE